ncbi:MAG: phage portal protein, partial [Coriobacteriales bacterium]
LSDTSMLGAGLTWTRVEARGAASGRRNILHVITRERAGQVRGVPVLAPVLEALKQLGRYTEAEINAAVISAMFTVFVQPQTATDARPFGEMLPPDQQIDTMDQSSIELGNGAIVGLNPGETVAFADPKHPNAGYDAFTDAMIKQIGSEARQDLERLFDVGVHLDLTVKVKKDWRSDASQIRKFGYGEGL